ncbi:MAG: helix-turn-helix transcriptional regulator [Hyphomonadaceae bacterium]
MSRFNSTRVVDHLIGAMVAACRLEAGLSQKQLAARTGIKLADLRLHEAGTERIPASALLKIAQVLDTPISYFFSAIDIADATGLGGSRPGTIGPAECARVIEIFSQFRSPQAFEAAVSIARSMVVLEDALQPRGLNLPDDA